METGTEYVPATFYWQGYWRVLGEMAVNIAPPRTVPLEPLIARITEERAAGRNPHRDRNTIVNPLASPDDPGPPANPGGG